MSSREKFTASLRNVFAVAPALPPPPPSSRRTPRVPSTPPPPPSRRPNARTSAPPDAVASDAGQAHAPDSLVPVRLMDLLDERPSRARSVTPTSRRGKIATVGAFVAGAALMLGLQRLVTRPGQLEIRPAALPQSSVTKLLNLPEVPQAASAEAPGPATTVEPPPLSAPSAESAAVEPAASSADESGAEPPPPKRRRRARSSLPEYEPPTAAFPDYTK